MSIAVYKKRIQSSDTTWGNFNITAQTLREIAAYATSISGLLINNDALPYNVYSSLDFSGSGMEECVFKWSTASNSEMVWFGVCKDGHTEYTNPDTFVRLSQYSHMDPSGTNLVNDLYLIVKDGRLVYIACKYMLPDDSYVLSSGGIFLFYDDDGLRVGFQGGGGNSSSMIYGDLKAYDDTNNRPLGTVILGGEYELSGRLVTTVWGASVAGGTYKTPTGKALIYPVFQNDRANRASVLREYPVGIKCDDLGVTGTYNVAPKFKKIQIDSQKYIHVGDHYWMPYDTYSESVINV